MLKTSKYTDLYLMTTLYLCTIYMYFRFIVIVLPMKSRSWCTSGNTQRILASVWIVSLLLSSPAFYVVVKFFVTDLFKFRALVQINYIWCCDQIETWSLIITFSWWWTLLSFNPSSNISFVLYNNKKELSKIYIIYFTIKLPLEIWVMIGLQYYLVVEEGETAKNQGHVLQQVWPEKEPSLMKGHQLFA